MSFIHLCKIGVFCNMNNNLIVIEQRNGFVSASVAKIKYQAGAFFPAVFNIARARKERVSLFRVRLESSRAPQVRSTTTLLWSVLCLSKRESARGNLLFGILPNQATTQKNQNLVTNLYISTIPIVTITKHNTRCFYGS